MGTHSGDVTHSPTQGLRLSQKRQKPSQNKMNLSMHMFMKNTIYLALLKFIQNTSM